MSTWANEVDEALDALDDEIPADAARHIWLAALEATWSGPPVWAHGDVVGSNLLLVDGRLSAVIDFGRSAVGDPACDLLIAWTLFSGRAGEGSSLRYRWTTPPGHGDGAGRSGGRS